MLLHIHEKGQNKQLLIDAYFLLKQLSDKVVMYFALIFTNLYVLQKFRKYEKENYHSMKNNDFSQYCLLKIMLNQRLRNVFSLTYKTRF